MRACVCGCVYACVCTYMCVHSFISELCTLLVRIYVCTHVSLYEYMCICVYISVCMCKCICDCVCFSIHIYIYEFRMGSWGSLIVSHTKSCFLLLYFINNKRLIWKKWSICLLQYGGNQQWHAGLEIFQAISWKPAEQLITLRTLTSCVSMRKYKPNMRMCMCTDKVLMGRYCY